MFWVDTRARLEQQASEVEPERRALVAAPTGRDAEVLSSTLGEARIEVAVCADLEVLSREVEAGAAVLILAEEVFVHSDPQVLVRTLLQQPEWSDLPLILIGAKDTQGDGYWRVLDQLEGASHAVLMPRPLRKAVLLSAVRAALISRRRQYQVRDELLRRRKAEQALLDSRRRLRAARDELEQRVAERTKELRRRAEQLMRLTSELALAEQRERERIRDLLHDHLQQYLVSAKMLLEAAGMRPEADQRSMIDTARLRLDEAIEAARSLSVELRPPILREGGLAAALRWLAGWMSDRHGFEVELALDDTIDARDDAVRTLVFEALRELLFNVVKHAGVKHAALELAAEDDELLRVSVVDRGRGFDAGELAALEGTASARLGLFGVRERMTLLGGRFDIESEIGRGTRVTLVAPRRRSTEDEARQPR